MHRVTGELGQAKQDGYESVRDAPDMYDDDRNVCVNVCKAYTQSECRAQGGTRKPPRLGHAPDVLERTRDWTRRNALIDLRLGLDSSRNAGLSGTVWRSACPAKDTPR